MGTIEQLTSTGLDVELDLHFETFFSDAEKAYSAAKLTPDQAKATLRKIIDEHGLQSKPVIQQVGKFQRQEILVPGIYQELKSLDEKLVSGGNGTSTAAAPAPKPEPAPVVAQPEAAQTEAVETESVDLTGDIDGTDEVAEAEAQPGVLTDADEEKIREQLRKEEEKLRAKIAARELKLREAAMNKKQKKSQKMGLKAEEVAEIESLKTQIQECTNAKKKLKEESVALQAKIVAARNRIAEIKPKKAKPAAVKFDAATLKDACIKIYKHVKATPACKSQDIMSGLSLDRKLFTAAMKELQAQNKISKAGRGPYTTYSVA